MPEEDLINFIKQRLAEGFDKEAIRGALLETGHSSEEIESAFKAISEMPSAISKEPEAPKGIEIPAFQIPKAIKKEEFPFFKTKERLSKKIILPLIILVALIFVGGAAALLYDRLAKPDPISLLPQETAFYARIKINPENQQVKNLKENLAKFPMYEKLAEKISEEFEKMKKENPP